MGGFKCFFIFTPIPGEMIEFDEHIFQVGWNHHLESLRASQIYQQLIGPQNWGIFGVNLDIKILPSLKLT